MKYATAFVTLAAAALAAAQSLQINTPANVVQCLPQLITWSGGTPPYFLSVLPGNQPTAAALVDFGQQNGTSLTWDVNVQAGTSVGLTIRDSTGATEESAPFTIQSGGDSSCLSSSASFSGGTATAPASPGSSSSGASGSSTTGGSGSSSTGAAGSSTSKASTASSATSAGSSASTSSGAMPFAQIGSAGVLGAIAVALFA